MLPLSLLLANRAGAHDVGLSSATIRLQAEKIETQLTFAVKDAETLVELDTHHDGRVTPTEFAAKREVLNKWFAANGTLSGDAQRVEPDSVRAQLDETCNVVVQLVFPARQFVELEFAFDVIREMTPGHRMFVSVIGSARRNTG